jgi:hypothetical protein
MQVTLVQSEFCRTCWVLLFHGLVETRLDGSTGPYALLSYCSLHGLSRVQPSLWHCLATSTTAHQPVILQSAHSPSVLQDGSQLRLFILATNCNSQSWLAAAQTRDKISLQVVHFHYVQSPNLRITELHCNQEYYERGQLFSSSIVQWCLVKKRNKFGPPYWSNSYGTRTSPNITPSIPL